MTAWKDKQYSQVAELVDVLTHWDDFNSGKELQVQILFWLLKIILWNTIKGLLKLNEELSGILMDTIYIAYHILYSKTCQLKESLNFTMLIWLILDQLIALVLTTKIKRYGNKRKIIIVLDIIYWYRWICFTILNKLKNSQVV